MLVFLLIASDLGVGESATVSSDAGVSYTVTRHDDGTCNVTANNQQSREKLDAALEDEEVNNAE